VNIRRISEKGERATDQDEPLLSVAGVLSGGMLSAQEIEEELYGDRREAAL
jgi:hypothetical protein